MMPESLKLVISEMSQLSELLLNMFDSRRVCENPEVLLVSDRNHPSVQNVHVQPPSGKCPLFFFC